MIRKGGMWMLPSDLRTLCFLEAFHIPRWVEERGGGVQSRLGEERQEAFFRQGYHYGRLVHNYRPWWLGVGYWGASVQEEEKIGSKEKTIYKYPQAFFFFFWNSTVFALHWGNAWTPSRGRRIDKSGNGKDRARPPNSLCRQSNRQVGRTTPEQLRYCPPPPPPPHPNLPSNFLGRSQWRILFELLPGILSHCRCCPYDHNYAKEITDPSMTDRMGPMVEATLSFQ